MQGFFCLLPSFLGVRSPVQLHLRQLLFPQQERNGQQVYHHGQQHGGVVAAHALGKGRGAVQPADEHGGNVHGPVQEYCDPEVAGAEIDGRKQRSQRRRERALHQHAEGCRAGQVGQVGRAEQHAGQQAGFPDTGLAGAEVFQQRFGNDAPEQEFLRHAHHCHAGQKAQDTPRREQRRVRPLKDQCAVYAVADECQRVHPHQQTVPKAAAAAAQQSLPPGAAQQQPGRPCPHQLLYKAEKVFIQTGKICPGRHQRDGQHAIADQNATTFAAKDGSNLVLSLDVNVQEIAERYLTEAVAANNVENRGCAIVMNVKTGAILAMASKPDFDPNTPLDYSANLAYLQEQVAAEPELYTIYLRDENDPKKFKLDENGNKIVDPDPDYTGTYRDILWKNKAITELYYPGSVFKVITSAMGLDSGVATMNTTFTCAGAYGVAKQTYHCAGHKAHGTINMADALRQSCNIYYIQLGQRVGSQQFYNYFDAFGFTERTGVDLPSETGLMKYYSANQLGEVQLASSAFGQAMAITPLQMCTAVAAAVNGGYLVTPHVVDKITDTNGNVVEEIGTNIRRQVISESTSDVIRQMMEEGEVS